jgi:hypothetical protein
MGPALAMTPRCHWITSPPRASWAAAPASRRFDGTPAAPAFTARGGLPGHAPEVGRGTRRDQREAVSSKTGLVSKHHPKVHPTPTGALRRRRKRLTTRPACEPSLTGPSPGGGEPAAFEWPRGRERTSIGTGRALSLAQPPCSAERGRQSPHVCWVRLVPGPRGQESRLLPITSRVAAGPPSPLPPSPRSRGQNSLTVPGRRKYCLLTQRALCGFGPDRGDFSL